MPIAHKRNTTVTAPSNQLLDRVVWEFGNYIANGGRITLDQLNDPGIQPGEVTQLLFVESFGSYLVKIGKGHNLRRLCEQAILHLREPCPVVVEVGEVETDDRAKPVKVKIPKKRVHKMNRIRLGRSPAQVTPEMVQAERNEPDGLDIVRAAFKKKLFRYTNWEAILCNEAPETALEKMESLLKASTPRFIAELAVQLGSRSIVENHLKTVLFEIRLADQKTRQVAPATPRRADRSTRQPRRAPSGTPQTA